MCVAVCQEKKRNSEKLQGGNEMLKKSRLLLLREKQICGEDSSVDRARRFTYYLLLHTYESAHRATSAPSCHPRTNSQMVRKTTRWDFFSSSYKRFSVRFWFKVEGRALLHLIHSFI